MRWLSSSFKIDRGIVELVGGWPGCWDINSGQVGFLDFAAYILKHTIGRIFRFRFANVVYDFGFVGMAEFPLDDSLVDRFLNTDRGAVFSAFLDFFTCGGELKNGGVERSR
jgi:hypothetical protein